MKIFKNVLFFEEKMMLKKYKDFTKQINSINKKMKNAFYNKFYFDLISGFDQ